MSSSVPPLLATRRWDLVEDEGLRETAAFFQQHGPTGCARVAARLYAHGMAVAPPTDEDRAADWRAHVELRLKLDRANARALLRSR